MKSVRPLGSALPRALVCAIGLLACGALVTVQAAARTRAVQGPVAPQTTYFAFFSTGAGYASYLLLNNASARDIVATPTFYNLAGQALVGGSVTVGAGLGANLNIADIIAAAGGGSAFTQGNLKVTCDATDPNMLGTQVSVSKPGQSLMFDVPAEMSNPSSSDTLDGLWWRRGGDSRFDLVVTNTTGSAVKATVEFPGRDVSVSQQYDLASHQTVIIDVAQLAPPTQIFTTSAGTIEAGGVHIVSTGPVGGVLAYGMVYSATTGFSSEVRFADPKSKVSNTLASAHFMVGEPDIPGFPTGTSFATIGLIFNNVEESVTVTPKVSYRLQGQPATVTLANLTVPGYSVTPLDLNAALTQAGVTGPIRRCGLTLTFDGEPDQLNAMLTSIDSSGTQVFDVPLKDTAVRMNRFGGSYPWRIDGNFQSILHVRNVTNAESEFTLQLDFPGDSHTSPLFLIPPQQEIAIDLRELRNLQVKDSVDRVIPSSVDGGRATWHEHNGQALIGRMEIYDPSAGIASSYSCPPPGCCPPGTFLMSTTPESLSILLGDGGSIQVNEFRQTNPECVHFPVTEYRFGPFNVTSRVTCESADPSVVSVENVLGDRINILGAGIGTTALHITVNSGGWQFTTDANGNEVCVYSATPVTIDPIVDVFDFTVTAEHTGIYPTLPQGYENSTVVTVQMNPHREGIPVAVAAKGTSNILLNGGHQSHTPLQQPSGTLTPASGTTNAAGRFQFTYTASPFSGEIAIEATISGQSRSEFVDVRVPNLAYLDFPSGAAYVRYGAGDNRHPNRHCGTVNAIEKLPTIALLYVLEVYGGIPANDDDKLHYNDMSLPWGGKFEAFDQNWCTGCRHDEHRLGINADVSSEFHALEHRVVLEDIFRSNGSPNFGDETGSANHWHLRFE